MKKMMIILLTLCALAAAQQDKPRIAVYVKGSAVRDEIKTALNTENTLRTGETY